MSPDSMIVEDGVDGSPPGSRGSSAWLLAAVGFGLGIALGTLIALPRETPVSTTVGESTPLGPVDEPRDEPTDRGVSEAVPGFPDALVAVGDSLGSGLAHLLWPVGGPLVTRSLTGGQNVRLDAKGQYVALSQSVPEMVGSVLSMGRFNGIRAVASGVTSYRWHDSQPGVLAFTTTEDGESRLYQVSASLVPSLVIGGITHEGTLATWGDWGYAIQRNDVRIQLLTRDGEPKDIVSGIALASHQSGWILVQDQGLKLVSGGGGVRRLERPDVPERIFAAAFSPDGSKVALAGRDGVVVFDLKDEEGAIGAPGSPAGWLTWSSDSRFVVAPAQSGVLIYDMEEERSQRVLTGQAILDAKVIRPSSQ